MNQSDTRASPACPLCGGDNDCAVSRGLPVEQCWCHGATFAPGVLEQLQPEVVSKRCICPTCAGQTKGETPGR